ncbi:type II toxin-antitoxin system VapC family toxin [Marinihelvus fidelis]|uniref:type II toxin-antitoxin system VapC family toxin n=1 Tax=Marinihelvus fidelis TaxID=2613842 RepID=UPI0038732DB6
MSICSSLKGQRTSPWTWPNDPAGHQYRFRADEEPAGGSRPGLAERSALRETLLSAVTIGEIAYGLRILPDGKRRSGLRERFERFVALAFDQRVLSYDEPAARLYGELMGDRRELGLPMSVPDGQIAAIARRDHLAIATRNVLDFEHCGIEVINPFEFTP